MKRSSRWWLEHFRSPDTAAPQALRVFGGEVPKGRWTLLRKMSSSQRIADKPYIQVQTKEISWLMGDGLVKWL